MISSKRLWLLRLLLKNSFSRKTFGRTPLEEAEPEPKRSPVKQALRLTNETGLSAGNFIERFQRQALAINVYMLL